MSAGISNYSSKFCVLSRPQLSCLVQILCLLNFHYEFSSLILLLSLSFRRKWKLRKAAISVKQNLKTCMRYSFSSEKIIHIRHLTKWWCSQKIIRQQAFCWFCLHLNCAPMENIFSLNRDFIRSELKLPSLSLHVFVYLRGKIKEGPCNVCRKVWLKAELIWQNYTSGGRHSSAQTWNTIGHHEDHKSQQHVLGVPGGGRKNEASDASTKPQGAQEKSACL